MTEYPVLEWIADERARMADEQKRHRKAIAGLSDSLHETKGALEQVARDQAAHFDEHGETSSTLAVEAVRLQTQADALLATIERRNEQHAANLEAIRNDLRARYREATDALEAALADDVREAHRIGRELAEVVRRYEARFQERRSIVAQAKSGRVRVGRNNAHTPAGLQELQRSIANAFGPHERFKWTYGNKDHPHRWQPDVER